MSIVGKFATFFSESFLSKALDRLFAWMKPVRYAIDDIFEFIFGSTKNKNAHRLLFCIGFGTLLFKLLRFAYRTGPIMSKLALYASNINNFNRLKFKEKYGANAWVLITGFTEGIGYAYAKQFARMRYNLVVVNKNDGRIQSTIRWLKQIHPTIQVKVIQFDFNTEPQKVYQQIYNKTADIDIGIVVNNVGITNGGLFIDLEKTKLLDTYTVNVNSQIQMSKIFIPRFKQRAAKSAFINMASCSGFFPCSRLGLYTATKTISDVFSRIITKQCQQYGIDILTLRPFGVATGMVKMKKGTLIVTPKDLVESALCELGHTPTSFGPLKHKLAGIMFSSLNEKERFDKYDAQFKKVREAK